MRAQPIRGMMVLHDKKYTKFIKFLLTRLILKDLPGNGVKLDKSFNDLSTLCLCQKSIPRAWKTQEIIPINNKNRTVNKDGTQNVLKLAFH